MSERERRVLDRLEQEFQPSPPQAPSRWLRISRAKRLAAALIALPGGIVLMILGLTLDSAGGVALAIAAYAVITGSVTTIVDCTPRARAALARRLHRRPTSRPPGYFR